MELNIRKSALVFLDTVFLLVFIFLTIVHYWFFLILGNPIPTHISVNDLKNYSIFSCFLFLLAYVYLIFLKGSPVWQRVKIILIGFHSLLGILLWLYTISNSLDTQNLYRYCAFSGLISSGGLFLFCLWRFHLLNEHFAK